MNEITKSNLENRLGQIINRLGELAYERQGYTLRMEAIDLEVAQMEAQRVLIEATYNDVKIDEKDEAGRLEKAAAVEKEARSKRAKDAAKKRKGTTPKAETREGKAATKA